MNETPPGDSTTPQQPVNTPSAVQPKTAARRRRWPRWLMGAAIGIGALVFVAPYLFNVGFIRNGLVRMATRDVQGEVHIQNASLGWFSPVSVGGIQVAARDGAEAVAVTSVTGDRPLWRMILSPRDLGTMVIDQPQIHLLISPEGSNLATIFPRPVTAAPDPDKPRETLAQRIGKIPHIAWGIEVRGARLTVQNVDSPTVHEAGDLRLACGVRQVQTSGEYAFQIDQGTVLDHVQITPEMCNAVLQYAAPVLARVSRASGGFSLQIDQWNLPLDAPQNGALHGKLSLHEIEIGPGPLIQGIAAILKIPPSLTLAEDSDVEFELRDGRIYHSRLEIHLGKLTLATQGSVGLDDTLDMVAEIPMPVEFLKEGPLRESLAQQTLVIPIGGTLDKPVIDAKLSGGSPGKLMQSILGLLGTSSEAKSEEEVKEHLDQEGLDVADLIGSILKAREQMGTPILDRWRERQLERQRAREQQAGEQQGGDHQGGGPPQPVEPSVDGQPATQAPPETPRPLFPRLRQRRPREI